MTRKLRRITLAAVAATTVCLGASAQTVLTMERALEIAQEASPTLRRSYLNMQRSQENLFAQRASLKSRFALTLNPATYSNTRSFDEFNQAWYTNESFNTNGTFSITQPILPTDATISLSNRFGWQQSTANRRTNEAFSNDLSLRIQQPLFTYNTQRMALREIEMDYENSYISYELQRLNTERNIAQQFYNVLLAQERLEIAKSEMENSQTNYNIVNNKVNAELSPRSELFQAEINLSNSRSSLQNREVSLENAKDNLRRALGMNIEEDIVVAAVLDSIEQVQVDLDHAVRHALANRMELRQRELTTESLEFQMITTKARNEFRGNLDLSIGLTGDNENFDRIYENTTRSPRVALSLNVPIFDWGEKRARIKAQEIAQEVNQIDAEEELKDMEIEVISSHRNLQNYLTQIEIQRQNVTSAKLTRDINADKYRNGGISGLDMNSYETQYSNAQINYRQALVDYKLELLNMKRIALYDYESGQSIVPQIPDVTKKNRKK